jgi:hypothetical protein
MNLATEYIKHNIMPHPAMSTKPIPGKLACHWMYSLEYVDISALSASGFQGDV